MEESKINDFKMKIKLFKFTIKNKDKRLVSNCRKCMIYNCNRKSLRTKKYCAIHTKRYLELIGRRCESAGDFAICKDQEKPKQDNKKVFYIKDNDIEMKEEADEQLWIKGTEIVKSSNYGFNNSLLQDGVGYTFCQFPTDIKMKLNKRNGSLDEGIRLPEIEGKILDMNNSFEVRKGRKNGWGIDKTKNEYRRMSRPWLFQIKRRRSKDSKANKGCFNFDLQ